MQTVDETMIINETIVSDTNLTEEVLMNETELNQTLSNESLINETERMIVGVAEAGRYNQTSDLIAPNQTEGSIHGARLILNSSFGYNATTGDFKSFVFYNYTNSTYWNITFSINQRDNSSNITTIGGTNITLQTRTANSYNITDYGLVGAWGLNNDTLVGENATFFTDVKGINNLSCS